MKNLKFESAILFLSFFLLFSVSVFGQANQEADELHEALNNNNSR